MQNTKENQAIISNLIDELIDSVIDDNTHDNCVQLKIDKLKQAIFSDGWFSTTKQLPKPNQLVIIAVDLGLDTPKICLGSYIKDDTPITDDGNTYSCSHWWNDDDGNYMWEFKEVKYWQWLPELPQVKE